MNLISIFEWLEDSLAATAVRESTWLFPTLESLHVLALAAMLGTIVVVDLRLLGLASHNRAASALMKEVLPFTRWAFIVTVVTGGLLFASNATQYVEKWPFLLKMALMTLALVNIVGFHRVFEQRIAGRDSGAPPLSARFSGAASLVLWIGVVGAGRWIGFV